MLITLIVAFRYYLIVFPFYWLFYRWRPQRFSQRQIYSELPGNEIQRFERRWSLLSSGIFGLTGVVLGLFWQKGWTQIYLRFDEMGWSYLVISPFLLVLLHETYFYWTHRLLHVPWFYRRFHSVHHESLHPSPWASFSFHPVESLLNALALPLIAMVMPLHPVVLLLHLVLMTVTAILNHLGFELLPRNRFGKWVGTHVVSALHHSQHHRYFRFNYALFMTFWDRWLGTEHPQFAQQLENFTRPKASDTFSSKVLSRKPLDC